MAQIVKMPVLGQTVEEVRILKWFKNEGDTVAQEEPLAEIETDKVSIEWASPVAGVVRRILTPVEEFVAVNAPVLIVGTADEPIDDLLAGGDGAAAPAEAAVETAAAPSAAPVAAPAGNGQLAASPRARRYAEENGIDIAALAGRGTGPEGRIQEQDVIAYRQELEAAAAAAESAAGRSVKASPLARAVASGEGVDLAEVAGSGSGGRIRAEDVRSASAPAPAAPVAPAVGGSRTVTMTGMRKRIADNIARSVRNTPHVTLNISVDMTAAQRLRKDLLPPIEKATGVRLSPTDIVVKAVGAALREMPYMNAHIDGDTLTYFDDVHVGLAVSLGEEGLIVPVIRDVPRRGLAEIATARQDVATRARKGQLGAADITGGTFTVSNLGSYGIESFNPVINPPQVAILGVCAISEQVVVVDGAPAVRPMMGLSLSFDHRAIDGAPAAAFLARLREILENPSLMLF